MTIYIRVCEIKSVKRILNKSMCSNVHSGAFENPCFVVDTELSIQSCQELSTQHRIDHGDAPVEHFERVSLSNSSEKCSLENSAPVLTRTSLSGTSSAPLEHLENFLSDARSSLDDSPVAALRRLSVVKFDPPEENYPRFLNILFFFTVATRIVV